MGRILISLTLCLTLCLSAQAKYRAPKPEQSGLVSLGQGLTGADLERIKIGHQAGILKVVGGDGSSVKFIKGTGTAGVAGIDGREWAPLKNSQRDQIVKALAISDVNALASALMSNYNRISRAHALALLGALAHPGEHTPGLEAPLRTKVLQFQRDRLQPAEDNIVRRQAVLALAIQPSTDDQTVASMLNFLRRDHNAWDTFGVVQFFEYQGSQIRKMPQFQGFLRQLHSSGSPHADQIIRGLKADQVESAPKTQTEPKREAPAVPSPDSAPGPVPSGRPTPIPQP